MRCAALILLVLLALAVWMFASVGPEGPGGPHRAAEDTATEAPLRLRGLATPLSSEPVEPDASKDGARAAAPVWETTGRVIDFGRRVGVEGATVRVELRLGEVREEVGVATTTADGRFHLPLERLDALSPAQQADASLHYVVRAEGYIHRAESRHGTSLVLAPCLEQRRAAVTLYLEGRPALRVRVVDTDNRPVEGAHVSISWVTGPGRSRVFGDGGPPWTNADGETVFALQPGHLAVCIHAWLHGVGESGCVVIPLSPDRPLDRLPDLVLRASGTIEGRAVFPDGTPAVGVDVYCALNEGHPVRPGNSRASDRTDAEGRFVLRGLWRASGRVGLIKPRTWSRAWTVPAVDVTTGARAVVLEVPLPRVRLHVVDPHGAPVSGTSYRARLVGEGPPDILKESITAADGTASVWCLPGDIVAVAVHSHALRPAEAVVDLPPGVWTRDLVMVMRAWNPALFGRIRFEVTHADGSDAGPLVPWIWTPLARQVISRFFRTSRGTNQRWSPGDPALPVPPGRWLLRIASGLEYPARWIPQLEIIEILPGMETVHRTTVGMGASLAMCLVSVGGRDDELRWWARLTPDDGHDRPIDRQSGPRRNYRWRLRAGGWTLRVEADGYEVVTRHVTLETGDEREIDIPLVPLGR